MPPFKFVCPTNKIAHFVEVSLYFILSSTTSEININIEQGDVFFPEFDENDFDITIEEMSEDNEQFTRKIYRRKVAVKNRNFKEQRYEYYCTAVSS